MLEGAAFFTGKGVKPVIACAIAMGLAMPASAQRQDGEAFNDNSEIVTGSRFKRAPETASQSDARQMQRDVARCVFDRNKSESRELLAHSSSSRIDFDAIALDPADFFDEFNVGDCIGRAMRGSTYRMRMSIQYGTLRNLLAEEAYVRDNSDGVEIPAGAPVNLENRYKYDQLDVRTAVLAELSDCIVHAQPVEADAFIRTRPGSKDEGEAIEALSPSLGPCLGGEAPPEVGASLVRQVIADGLWSRAYYGPMLAAEMQTSALPVTEPGSEPVDEMEAE